MSQMVRMQTGASRNMAASSRPSAGVVNVMGYESSANSIDTELNIRCWRRLGCPRPGKNNGSKGRIGMSSMCVPAESDACFTKPSGGDIYRNAMSQARELFQSAFATETYFFSVTRLTPWILLSPWLAIGYEIA